jgi:hypothetical protein
MRLPSGRKLARVKPQLLPQANTASAAAAQTRIGLELVDYGHEIIKSDDPFKLEARTRVPSPDHIGFDPAHDRQADNDPIPALQIAGIVNHEAVRREIADMQVHIAMHKVLDDRWIFNRMARGAPHIGYAEISPANHPMRSFSLLSTLSR